MVSSVQRLLLFGLCLFSTLFVGHSLGGLVTAGRWNISEVPYIPNACNFSQSDFPGNNSLIALVGDDSWHNGATCGYVYTVTCTSASPAGACILGQTVSVMIVGRASMNVTSIVLSRIAFYTIATHDAEFINIDCKLVTNG